jgi:hypothetical protein
MNNQELIVIEDDDETNHTVHFKQGLPSEIGFNYLVDEDTNMVTNDNEIFVNSDTNIEDDLEYYIPTDNNTNCYSTPTALKMMRSFSQNY